MRQERHRDRLDINQAAPILTPGGAARSGAMQRNMLIMLVFYIIWRLFNRPLRAFLLSGR